MGRCISLHLYKRMEILEKRCQGGGISMARGEGIVVETIITNIVIFYGVLMGGLFLEIKE